LEEGVVIVVAYKPGPHVRYLVEKMVESELGIHEVLPLSLSLLSLVLAVLPQLELVHPNGVSNYG
jgi:hypothetical protein